MISLRLARTLGVASVLAATLFGCSSVDEELAGGDPPLTTTAEALVQQQVNPQAGGFTATVSLISNFSGIGGWPDGTGSNTVRLAACNAFTRLDGTAGAQLYVATKAGSTRRLYVTNDAARDYVSGDPNVANGTTWTEVPSGLVDPATTQIGCDGHHLFALNGSNHNLYVAGIAGNGNGWLRRANGMPEFWTFLGSNALFNDLQSGAGNVYVVGPGTNRPLYTQDSTTPDVWKTFSNLPANFQRVTGAGKASLAKLANIVGNKMSGKNPPNRAFAIKVDGTLVYNDKVLSNPSSNTWTPLDFGSATFEDISVSAPDVLWAITNSGGMRHLHEIRFTETDCDDNLDNDADSLTDAYDPECMVPLATTFCAGASSRVYCSSRFSNSPDFLVTCSNHALLGAPNPGRCVESSGSANDTKISTNIAEPPNMGHWCSAVYRPSGVWALVTEAAPGVTNRDPCGFIVARQEPGQTTEIAGAGLYSLTGVNNVVGFCENGAGAGRVNQSRITGTLPIQDIVAFLDGHPACKFLVSPAELPIFDLPYDKAALEDLGVSISYGLVFDPETPDTHGAWDITVPPGAEGVPLMAVAAGTVVGEVTDPPSTGIPHAGSEDLPQPADAIGDSHQPGIMIVHTVQSGTTRYRERFVSVYNHMRQRIVVPGQQVQRGQVIGYIGQVGQAWGPHVHFGVVRLSNTVLSATDSETLMTVVPYYPWPLHQEVTTTSVVSPFGWRGPANQQDTWGTNFVADGKGAFSPKLWRTSSQTPSPPPAVTSLGW